MRSIHIHIACFLLFLVVACLVACKPPAATTTSSKVKDSVRVEYRDREIPVPVPGEKLTVTEYIECDSNTNKPKPTKFEANGSRSNMKGSIDDTGKLQTECTCDSLTLLVHAKDSIISRYRSESKSETKVEQVYLVHWYDKWARAIALLALLFSTYKLKHFLS
jgi:hypothetical protein